MTQGGLKNSKKKPKNVQRRKAGMTIPSFNPF